MRWVQIFENLVIREGGDPGPDLVSWSSQHAEDPEQLINLRVALNYQSGLCNFSFTNTAFPTCTESIGLSWVKRFGHPLQQPSH